MKYFEGIQWINAMHIPDCTVWLENWSASFHALNYAREGQILWAIGDREPQILRAPVAWWTCPGQTYTYGASPGKSWDHCFITFRGPRVQRWIHGGLLPTDPNRMFTPILDAQHFSEYMDSLVREFNHPVRQHDLMVNQLESALLCCSLAKRTRVDRANKDAWGELIHQLNHDPAAGINWQQTARHMGLSTVHFRRRFHQLTGYAPQQYLIQIRMRAAAQNLRTSNQPIKRIAADLGYDNIYYFTKLFKDRFGLPPGQYRRETQLPHSASNMDQPNN